MNDKSVRSLYLFSALIGISGAFYISLSPLPYILKGMAVIFFFIGLFQFLKWHFLVSLSKGLTQLNIFQLSPSKFPGEAGEIYLGKGFNWDNRHVQEMYNLSKKDTKRFLARNEELGGKSVIHGVGAREERNIFIPEKEFVGHVALVGATRVGKTRALEMLMAQAIRRKEPVVVIDPKGEKRLQDFCYSQTIASGREKEDFVWFSLPYPRYSATYNPLSTYSAITDIPDRITALLPQAGTSKDFTDFCHGVVLAVAQGLNFLDRVITLSDIGRYALSLEYLGQLMTETIGKHLGENIENFGEVSMDNPEKSIKFYRNAVRGGMEINESCEGLIDYYQHPREHFEKMAGGLRKLLSSLNAGENRKLLSAVPADIDWENLFEKRSKVAYFSLASLLGKETASAIAQITLQDLVSYVGRRYTYTSTRSPVWIFIDEFQNVCYPGFIDLISKAGGAGLRVVIAIQSIADLEANMGYNAKAAAQQILDNTNIKIFMRATDMDTPKKFTDKVGKTTIKEYSEMTSITPEVDDSQEVFDTSFRKSKRDKEVFLVRPEWINELPKGHAFVYSQGGTYKVRFPLLPEPERNFLKDKGIEE